MELSIFNKLKKLWDAWHLRGCIILSLFLQAFLVSFASRRRQSKSALLLLLIWSAYLLADWVAAVAIGSIIKSQGDLCEPVEGENEDDLLSFWASFLLLHLGGPDSITSFALEDNEFWLRHIFGLALQGLAATYSIYLTLPTTKLWLPAALVLVVGVVKYWERTYALYLASLDRFAKDKQPPDQPTTTATTTSNNIGDVEKDSSHDMELLQQAYKNFQVYRGPLLGRFCTFMKGSPDLAPNHASAFKLIESELSIMYEVLHTKLVVVRRRIGYVFRFAGLCFIVSASIAFLLVEKKGLAKFDVGLTYTLLIVAIVLEFALVVQLVCSDWTLGALEERWKRYVPSAIARRQRWSGSVHQYNMISYCLDERRMWIPKMFVGENLNGWGNNVLDKIKITIFSSSQKVPEDAKSFIFDYVKTISDKAYSSDTGAFEAVLFRGLRTTWHYPQIKWSITKFEYAESLLLWHLATELICSDSTNYDHDNHSRDLDRRVHQERNGSKRICKLISDYMFYLMVMQPSMLSPVLGSNWKVGFQDTLADAKRFFAKNKITLHSAACTKIISLEAKLTKTRLSHHDVHAAGQSDDDDDYDHVIKRSDYESKSLLLDACMLAKELRRMDQMWEAMDWMWVELMCYAAANCRPIVHAQQLGKGGELLTLTWLLLNHLGLGYQFLF
ncbi:hypothetical protein PanWU01x14_231530 [Parasponia andersonii]|uniref:DUF4220 domain-containing protein n=1 Tax=Parasponia andersonii TaxID=3476 RepID=A0A2P5BKG9_PARAD|nr:hypothetical protein PanWU01x14_231530 [Parasponia andersonii]